MRKIGIICVVLMAVLILVNGILMSRLPRDIEKARRAGQSAVQKGVKEMTDKAPYRWRVGGRVYVNRADAEKRLQELLASPTAYFKIQGEPPPKVKKILYGKTEQVEQVMVLIPDHDPNDKGIPQHPGDISPGTHNVIDLLREYKHNPVAIQFIADMLEQ